jgi:hypothetical protein
MRAAQEFEIPSPTLTNRLLKNAWVDPLVLRDAMLCIAPQHEGINGIITLALFLRSR